MRYVKREQKTGLFIDALIIFLIFSAIILSCLISFDYEGFMSFAERNIANDGLIDSEIESLIRLYTAMLYVLILLILIKFFNPVKVKVESVKVRITYALTLFLMIFHYFYSDIYFIFGEDRLMEVLTVVFAIFSAGIFLFLCNKQNDGKVKKIFFLLSCLMFVFAMEEISWSQRIFSLETPEILRRINVQNEINIHNIFNFMIVTIHVVAFSMIASFFLFREQLIGEIKKRSVSEIFLKMIPNSDYYYFGYIFLFLAGYGLFRGGELSEEIFSIFIFVYSIDLLVKFKNKNYLN